MKPKDRRYKVILRKNQLSAKSIKTVTDVTLQNLAHTIYGLLAEHPGCCATIIYQPDVFYVKPKGITKNLTKLLGNNETELRERGH